jgi:glycosyltransferase involved in cell wall biosynthesis
MLNVNKNYGFTKATGDWIVNLDADEQIDEELAKEIVHVINDESSSDVRGYAIPRKNIIFGKWMQYTGWYPDYQLRLFQNGRGKFFEEHVHEQIHVEGVIGKLTHHILHENYQTVTQFLQKMFVIYAPNEADNILKQKTGSLNKKSAGYVPYSFSWKDAVGESVGEFIRRFYSQKGYKDGVHGLMLSVLMAFYYFVVYSYVWEKQQFVDDKKSVLRAFSPDTFRVKELRYWHLSAKIHETRNPMKKLLYTVQRKLQLSSDV